MTGALLLFLLMSNQLYSNTIGVVFFGFSLLILLSLGAQWSIAYIDMLFEKFGKSTRAFFIMYLACVALGYTCVSWFIDSLDLLGCAVVVGVNFIVAYGLAKLVMEYR